MKLKDKWENQQLFPLFIIDVYNNNSNNTKRIKDILDYRSVLMITPIKHVKLKTAFGMIPLLPFQTCTKTSNQSAKVPRTNLVTLVYQKDSIPLNTFSSQSKPSKTNFTIA